MAICQQIVLTCQPPCSPAAPGARPDADRGDQGRYALESDDHDDGIFPPLKADLEAAGLVRIGTVGSAVARPTAQREVVDLATAWFERRAAGSRHEEPTVRYERSDGEHAPGGVQSTDRT
ncbi:AAC(3) family N-acetyltransferase [Deinococcus pimensis]|uniref:AAC(3) family N-acetyltransferase n=1 Tax=Deinococcus pimensis TaxID=309888 RepID=UPI00146FB62F|nr:AAC(3) family N-acetyltransferase [Deinococcus pimensis]